MRSTFPSTLRRVRDGLQVTPWLSLIGYGVLILFYGGLVSLFLPKEWRPLFMRFLVVASLLMLVAKDFACLPLHVARIKAARAHGAPLSGVLHAAVPPAFLAYVRLERAMWRGFFGWMLRRQAPPRPNGTPLGYLERGSYGTVICCVLVGLLIEAPIDVMIASVMAKTPAQLHLLHAVFGLLLVYSLVWVLGDRWHVAGRHHHILTQSHLVLDIGPRGCGTIALNEVISCERLTESRKAWCQRHGHALHATRQLTPFDAPNVLLLLQPECNVRLKLLQLTCGGDTPVFLYLDRPELLCTAVGQIQGAVQIGLNRDATSPASDAGAGIPPCRQ